MNREDFERLAAERGAGIDARALRAALDEAKAGPGGAYYQADVGAVLARAREIQDEEQPGAASRTEKNERGMFQGPGQRIERDQRLEAVAPWVEKVRAELRAAFGGELVLPFRRAAAAVEWIEREAARKSKPRRRLDRKRREQLTAEIYERLRALQELNCSELVGFRLPRLSLRYVKPGSEWVHKLALFSDSRLAPFARAVADMARVTGFPEHDLTLYVLAGIKPALAAASITTAKYFHRRPEHSVEGIGRREVTVTIRSPELTREQFLAVHRKIRSEWGAKRRPLTPAHELLLTVVRELGGVPPARGAGAAFWRRVQKKIAGRGGPQYETYRGAEVAWHRLQERLPRKS